MRRQLRVSENIRHQLADILRDYSWRHAILQSASISIMQVNISPDLKNATLFVLPLNANQYDEEAQKEIIKALNHEAGMLKKILAESDTMRFIPKLKFVWDSSYDISGRIEEIIQKNQSIHE